MRRFRATAGAALGLLIAASTSLADEPSSEAVLAELPILEAPEPNRVVIDLAAPGNRPLRVLLDTGAALSYATPRAARDLGIRVRRQKSSAYRRATLLGRDLQLLVDASSSDTGARTNWEYVVVGGDFLARYVLEIDFHRVRVRFLDPERYQVPEQSDAPGTAVLPLRVVGNRPVVEVHVGKTRVPFLIDTGLQGTLIVSGEWVERAGLQSDPDVDPAAEGTLGPLRVEAARAARLRLGSFEERDVPILLAPRGLHNQGIGSDSLLGVDLLRRFVVRIDYPRRRLWLWEPARKPGDDAPSAP